MLLLASLIRPQTRHHSLFLRPLLVEDRVFVLLRLEMQYVCSCLLV
jgi:hypothetical protein